MKLILCLVLLMTISSIAQSKPEVSLGVELNNKNQYRVGFFALNFTEEESFNKTALEPVSAGLSPSSAKIFVKNKDGGSVTCGSVGGGYSSASMSSSFSFGEDKFEPLPQGSYVYSPWLSLEDLMRGFKQCSNSKIEAWNSFKIVFSIELSSIFLTAESEWHSFDADFLKRL